MIGSAGEQNKARQVHPVVHGNCLPMWIYDRRTLRFLEVSEGAIHLYGYTREEFLTMTIGDLGPLEDLTKLAHLDPASVNGNHSWTHRRKDGRQLSIALNSNALIYKGHLARLVVAREIDPTPLHSAHSESPPATSQEARQKMPAQIATQAAREFARCASSNGTVQMAGRPLSDAADAPLRTEPVLAARHDWTCGLPDRMLLEQRAEEALVHAERTRRRVAIVCLELDNLEEVFERLGVDGAEACVAHVAACLTRRLRGMDTVARAETKAFTIILAELDDDFALHRVAQALLKIFAEPVYIQGQPFAISASIGVAVYPDDGPDLARLSRAADTAMHQARASGGHRIAMFSLEVSERTELDAYMRETMNRNGFRLYYQPQYAPGGEVRTLEALLRLPGKETGFISPDLFIPVAEDSGMIEQLGIWVIEQASRQVKAWHREFGRLAHVAVNVSPLQLRGPDFAERALSVIRSHGVAPASIEFEITERAVLNFDEVCEPMRKLSEAGIVFAVDDFGTGYSSLQHLHRLPISVLKIDRSFVQRMGVQRMGVPEGAEAIVEAIVSMAHSLGMRVVAEGVETMAQRSAATQMGCDSIQGFFHTPAVDASKIPGLMGWLS
jgi:diguanylate cyclase (GGDEF)-like protein